jgi:hypothetical protein
MPKVQNQLESNNISPYEQDSETNGYHICQYSGHFYGDL